MEGCSSGAGAGGGAGGGGGGGVGLEAGATTSPALLALESQFDDVLDSINNIFVAAGDGELAKVQAFVASGVSVNSQDEYGYTPLCVSAQDQQHPRALRGGGGAKPYAPWPWC